MNNISQNLVKTSPEAVRSAALDKLENNGAVSPQLLKICDDYSELKRAIVSRALKIADVGKATQSCCGWALPNRKTVGITFDGDKCRFSASHLVHCNSVWLCPDCRSHILTGRKFEIGSAFAQWKNKGGSVFMVTLTASHIGIDTPDLVKRLQECYEILRHRRIWVNAWKDCPGPVGQSIIGNYEMTFGKSGIHPHRHLLFFTTAKMADFIPLLLREWVKITREKGLKTSLLAQNFEEIHRTADYISKIGWEMTNSAGAKEGKKIGRIDYLTLCRFSCEGQSWAIAQLRDYAAASHGLRALHWSKDMKKYFKIDEISDNSMLDGISYINMIAWTTTDDYNKSSPESRAAFLVSFSSALKHYHAHPKALIFALKISKHLYHFNLFDKLGDLILDMGDIIPRELPLIRQEIAADRVRIQRAIESNTKYLETLTEGGKI